LPHARPEVPAGAGARAARVGRLAKRTGGLGAGGIPGPAPQPGGRPAPAERPAEEIPSAEPKPVVGAEREESRPAPAASEPEPAPQSKAGEPPLQFSQLQEIWPSLFGSLRDVLGARRWALFREVVPGGTEDSTIILHVPHEFHLVQLQE